MSWLRAATPCLLATALLRPVPAEAAIESDGGVWLMGLGQGSQEEVGPKLSRLRWWLDLQLQPMDDSEGFHQGIVRPGVGRDDRSHDHLTCYASRAAPPGLRRRVVCRSEDEAATIDDTPPLIISFGVFWRAQGDLRL